MQQFLLQSVSAFAPICNPMNCPWGKKAFTGYLGSDQERWKVWDVCVITCPTVIGVAFRLRMAERKETFHKLLADARTFLYCFNNVAHCNCYTHG